MKLTLSKSQEMNFSGEITKYFWACSCLSILLLISGSTWANTQRENTRKFPSSEPTLNLDGSSALNAVYYRWGYMSISLVNETDNEDCESAIPLSCGDSVQGSTVNATESVLGVASCSGGTPADVFYTLDVEEGNEYTVLIVGDNYDAVLAIYSGPCNDLTEIYCADNGFSAGMEENITFIASVTETLVIRTYDWSVSQGDFTISITCEAASFDCPELEANIGDECETADGEEGTLNANCDCIADNVNSTDNTVGFNFTMYPNPVDRAGSLTLFSNKSIDRYEVLDIAGKVIDVQTISNQNEIQIALRDYSAGLYILKAYSGSNFSTQKMTVR